MKRALWYFDDLPVEMVAECGQLVKANSIEGIYIPSQGAKRRNNVLSNRDIQKNMSFQLEFWKISNQILTCGRPDTPKIATTTEYCL